jgi:hypothetical protein
MNFFTTLSCINIFLHIMYEGLKPAVMLEVVDA